MDARMRRELDRHITGNWGEDQNLADIDGVIQLVIEEDNRQAKLRVIDLGEPPSDRVYSIGQESIEVLRGVFEIIGAGYVRTAVPAEEIYTFDL